MTEKKREGKGQEGKGDETWRQHMSHRFILSILYSLYRPV